MPNKKSKGFKRILAAVLAVVVSAGAVGGALYYNSTTAEARNSLSNVETIRENSASGDPYVILEVVGDLSDASLGYLVGGEEPVSNAQSIKDMASKDERNAKLGSYSIGTGTKAEELANANAFSYETYEEDGTARSKSLDIRGTWSDKTNGDYRDSGLSGYYLLSTHASWSDIYDAGAGTLNYDYLNDNSIVVYRNQVVYSTTGSGGYTLTLTKLYDDNMRNKLSGGTYVGLYTWQYFTATTITQTEDFALGQYIYSGVGATIEYAGIVVEDSGGLKLKNASGDPVPLPTDFSGVTSYYSVVEANSASSDLYKITSVDTASDGPYARSTGFYAIQGGELSETNCPSSFYADYYYLKDITESYYSYTPRTGTKEFVADYTQDTYQTFTYDGGFTNAEWFKDYVLDLDSDSSKNRDVNRDDVMIDVKTITISELNDYDLSDVDMIYLAGGYTSDISKETALALVNKIKLDKMPVMAEKSIMMMDTLNSAADLYGAYYPNLDGLLIWMLQKDDKYSISDVTADTWSSANLKTGLSWPDLFANMYAGDKNGDYSFVHGTSFVNDDSKAGKIVSADFNTEFSNDKTSSGFQELIDEINSENVYVKMAGETEIPVKASKATAIRHILNAGDARIVFKSSLRVLDLEPYDISQYGWDYTNYEPTSDALSTYGSVAKWGSTSQETVSKFTFDYFDKSWFISKVATQFSNSTEAKNKVTVDMQGTAEFVGRQEILNENYDLIYIGMDTTLMNTSYRVDTGEKSDNTLYNDGNMNGLVYYHIGDLQTYTDSPVASQYGRTSTDSNSYRSAGNDITYNKYVELSDYIKAGYAVMLSDEFLAEGSEAKDDNGVNLTKLDRSSYLYKLINEVVYAKDSAGNYLYLGKNVNYKSNLDEKTAASTFSKYVNISGLTIKASRVPTPYTESDGVGTYLEMNNGVYSLDYTVTLENSSQVGSDTKYDVGLYVDNDSNGKFESDEKLSGLTITTSDGAAVPMDSTGKYSLSVGTTYNISRQLPDEYVGFISWKLVFTQNAKNTDAADSDKRSVKSAVSGFCAVKASAEQKKSVSILQIIPKTTGGYTRAQTLDLTSEAMKTLYSKVNDFNITVTKIPVEKFIDQDNEYFTTGQSYFDYLSQYDMIVMGFTDVYEYLGESSPQDNTKLLKSINAIREYALSGRSVLFTHDLTNSFLTQNSNNDTSGYYMTTFMRDIMGMDRYGVTKTNIASLGSGIVTDGYKSLYDTPSLKGSTVGSGTTGNYTNSNVGYTNYHLVRFHNVVSESNKGFSFLTNYITHKGSNNLSVGGAMGSASGQSTQITRINAGQITEYPFNISETVQANNTHPQYFQLNMDTNADDDIADDVTVWYTISNTGDAVYSSDINMYARLVPKDARNNYYIYSKGNITYTGAGHSSVTSTEERELFVNTLVAAYIAGTHAPKVLFKENPRDTSATVTSTYMPYDASYINAETGVVGDVLDGTLTINFKTINNNFTNSSESLYTKYYYKVKAGTSGAIRIGDNYYKEITPKKFQYVDALGNATDTASSGLLNYAIYTAVFDTNELGAVMTKGIEDTSDEGMGKITAGAISSDGVKLYVRIGTEPLADDLSSVNYVEPATESMNELGVYSLPLKDLR